MILQNCYAIPTNKDVGASEITFMIYMYGHSQTIRKQPNNVKKEEEENRSIVAIGCWQSSLNK